MRHCSWAAGLAAVTICCATARAVEHANSLTLANVVELVLAQNADLRASVFGKRAAEVLRQYAARPNNPNLSIQLEDFLGTGETSGYSGAQTTIALSQKFELGGKRGARVDLASSRASSAHAAMEMGRTRLVAKAVAHFVHVAADQRRFEVSLKGMKLAEQVALLANRRARSGAASSVETRRARIALARSKIRTEHAEHELRASKRRLSAMWGDAEGGFDQVDARLFVVPPLPRYETLIKDLARNSTLADLAQKVAIQRAQLKVEEAEGIPDVTVSLGGRRIEEPESYSMVLGVQMPLPFFQRNQGPIGAATLTLEEILAKRSAEKARLRADLYGYVQEFSHARQELDVLDKEVLPEAQSVLDLVTEGFGAGRFSQVELLDAQETLVEIERERIAAAEKMWLIAVQVQQHIGSSPDGLLPDGGRASRGDTNE